MSPEPSGYGRLKLRRDESYAWESVNPVLAEGEPGFEVNTGRIKVGDGVTAWNDLGFLRSTEMIDHLLDETPHPVYDDAPSLFLLYENAKV